MNKLNRNAFFLLSLLGLGGLPAFAEDVWVDGYTRANGTVVPGHYRSRPDGNPYNNYSAAGNSNPYTGQRGYSSPGSGPSSFGRDGLPTNIQPPAYGNGGRLGRY